VWAQLDIILPVQHLAPRRNQAPEQRLMIAVLHDAIDCLEKYRFASDPHGQRLFQEATRWLLADETDWLYSFECICRMLDLNANAVRRHLRVAPKLQYHLTKRVTADAFRGLVAEQTEAPTQTNG
jgi:hypothetical protein